VKMQENTYNKRILVFAGTTESHLVISALLDMPVKVYISVATEYGRMSFSQWPDAEVISGRMDIHAIQCFIREKNIDVVIDATHPFAKVVTANISAACKAFPVDYIRCLRDESELKSEIDSGKIFMADSVKEAVNYLQHTTGNIFIATGSKELAEYTKLENYQERCYARVLSVRESIEESLRLGFIGCHLIAMQGPFSKELNTAMLNYSKASYFVTKESGKAGGFDEKLLAASETGTELVVVGRPQEYGQSVDEVCAYLRKLI
jgi:precorrin-6A/cobalt-precorrin-6A reductase